ncbi:DUF4365 domain-containing protein [Singulisphaera rosea]
MKRRTREHIIADLCVNFVERFILLGGHSSEVVRRDHGIDLLMFTYNEVGEIGNGHILLQLKATERLKILSGTGKVAFSINLADLDQLGSLEPRAVAGGPDRLRGDGERSSFLAARAAVRKPHGEQGAFRGQWPGYDDFAHPFRESTRRNDDRPIPGFSRTDLGRGERIYRS